MRSTSKRKRRLSQEEKSSASSSDGLDEVEVAHEALLSLAVFVTIARELDQNERWRSRIYVLLESAMAPLDTCLVNIDKALKAITAHRRLRSAGVASDKAKQAP